MFSMYSLPNITIHTKGNVKTDVVKKESENYFEIPAFNCRLLGVLQCNNKYRKEFQSLVSPQ